MEKPKKAVMYGFDLTYGGDNPKYRGFPLTFNLSLEDGRNPQFIVYTKSPRGVVPEALRNELSDIIVELCKSKLGIDAAPGSIRYVNGPQMS